MKKGIAVFTTGILCVIIISYFFKFHYPPLPMDNITKRAVIEKGQEADQQLVKLTTENNHDWYIANERNISAVDDMIKELVGQKGWEFEQKEGSGLFFKRQEGKLIVTTEMWTGNYVLCQIPSYFSE